MKWAFLISGLAEVLGAIIIYFNGSFLFPEANLVLYKMYALAAFTIGTICLIMWKHSNEDMISRFVFLTIMFFHAALSFVCFSASFELFPLKLGACIFHFSLFFIFFLFYMKDIKPTNQ